MTGSEIGEGGGGKRNKLAHTQIQVRGISESFISVKDLIHDQALSHDSGAKHSVARGADRLWLHGRTVFCAFTRLVQARFLTDTTHSPMMTTKSVS